jgi:hypothetical protein
VAEIRNAKDARSFVAAWNGHAGRDSYLRIAAEGAHSCAAIAERQGQRAELRNYRAAERVLREAIA